MGRTWQRRVKGDDMGGGGQEDIEMKQTWVGVEGIMSKGAGKTDIGVATLRAKNGKMVSTSRG